MASYNITLIMGLCGFLLLNARVAWAKVEEEVEELVGESLTSSHFQSGSGEMVCPHSQASSNCHAKLVAIGAGLLAGGAVVGYFVGTYLTARKARCNGKIKLDTDKVVDSTDIEDIGEKKAFCRCWKSEKFPYCDGSHNKHNKDTGDNVGPLIVSGKKEAS
ncbi:unnamed protein product [Bursaphelenchus xylophilus]|uniref:CDGSH iron-sulfur domain-containing protein 2 homologue n=1 Tax=Bursaphelenchus xylophilus TaxID=6326 RepID=A0A1I7SCB0_BURXY|nr:unnamed protein product [Bursaphelenchus xylophilus]CAG9094444.1 unnamed protein product [Bursaphelenchus xylophilus]